MKGVTLKLLYGLFLVFLIAFFLLMINISVNQSIVSGFQSNLGQNSSLKFNHEMLAVLDELNEILMEDSAAADNESIISRQDMYLHELEKRIQLQEQSSTNSIELELKESLDHAFRRFSLSVKGREYTSNYRLYQEKFLNLRQYVLDIFEIKFKEIEREDEEISRKVHRALNIQKKAGITGIVIIGLIMFLLPVYLCNKIENLTDRLLNHYQSSFNKDIEFESGKQLERLEEVVNKILMELDEKSGNT